ncbi:MAG: ATP-binding protein [Muribaculaceae bacterium]|nr:ATP-binding protein [Muribaculaceae bacterium]
MSKEKLHIPQADMLMGSMRSMGYSFESALADVIDNSISANAENIRLLFPTNPLDKLAVGVLDDGDGMSKDVLLEAMRYGSTSSEAIRDKDDLGRFGLGLKSASLSQCRILTVISFWNGKISAYQWNYNYILEKKNWLVLSLTNEEISVLPYFDELKKQKKGTLIIWQDFDILSKSHDGQVYDALNDYKDKVAHHISLIFHRYMARSKAKVSMFLNNQKLRPLDPFLESHPKTTYRKEISIAITDSYGQEQHIKIRPYILPFLTDMSDKDKKLIGGVEEMRSKQGFYVYRNERLIIWGNWFGMSRRHELTKNARIRVDIPNSLDDIWSIDVKKQVASIPKRIQNQLKKCVDDALGTSVTKQTHRGRKKKVDDDIDYIWDRMEGRDKTFYYQINRESELIKYIRSKVSEQDISYIDMLLSEIEKTVPLHQIYVDKSNDCVSKIEEDDSRLDDIYQMAISMVDNFKQATAQTTDVLIDHIMKSEPFCLYPSVKEKLVSYYSHETE